MTAHTSYVRSASVAIRGAAPATAAGGLLASLVAAYLVVKGHTSLAFAVVLAAPLVVFVAARPWRSFALGLVVAVVVPFTDVFGSRQLSAPRLSILAVVAAFVLGAAKNQPRLRLSPIGLALGGFVIFGFVSWQLGQHPPRALQTAIAFLLPTVFFIAGRRLVPIHVRTTQWLLLAFGAAASLTVYVEYFLFHRPLFVDPATYPWDTEGGKYIFRPGGVFESPPAAGSILGMIALFSIPLLRSSRGAARFAASACFLCCIGAMAITFTRSIQIGFVAGVVVYLILSRPAHWGRFVFSGALAGLVVVLVLLPRLEHASWYQKGVLRSGTFGQRQTFWAASWPVITNSPDHLLLGHGINSLLIARGQLVGAQPYGDISKVPTLLDQSPQSQYIRTLIEEGSVGLAFLAAWLLGTVALGARYAWRRDRPDRLVVAAATAAVVSLITAMFATDSLRQPTTLGLLSLLSGLLVTLCARERRNHHEPVANTEVPVPASAK